MKQGKLWGNTRLIAATPAFEYHRLEIRAGGFCSKHKHQSKTNGFYVESGRLLVHVWHGDVMDTTELSSGQYTHVPAGIYHQFEALSDCVAFELYWAQYQPDDIERENQGGIRTAFADKPNG